MSSTVLLTGASSFTGLWIAEALVAAGFDVIAPLRRESSQYEGVRKERVHRLRGMAEVVFSCPFGSGVMLDMIRRQPQITALAHHAADVDGYRNPDFDAFAAFRRNLEGAPEVIRALADRGARVLLVTGTVFEAGEGGEGPLAPAVTAYGLSKTLTSTAFRYLAECARLRFGRLVVPSPYGAFEEKRFNWYLFKSWLGGETPVVRTPLYVRDHIAAPLLARAYAEYLAALLGDASTSVVRRPSGWIASQGEFGRRLAAEAAPRLGRACPLAFNEAHAFDEPALRVNDEHCMWGGGEEDAFWDNYVDWYRRLHAEGRLI